MRLSKNWIQLCFIGFALYLSSSIAHGYFPPGSSCTSSSQCERSCTNGFCEQPNGYLAPGTPCTSSSQCERSCTNGICEDASGYLPSGSSCTSSSQCRDSCVDGYCEGKPAILAPGSACTSDLQCQFDCKKGRCTHALNSQLSPFLMKILGLSLAKYCTSARVKNL